MIKSTTKAAVLTKELGGMLAKAILSSQIRSRALVVALQGELGSGKTTFTQGLAKGLGVQERVLSPTFVISRRFGIPKHPPLKNLFHIDCYRLKKSSELLLIDWKDMVKDPSNIVVLEWPERVARFLPKDTLFIAFSHRGGDMRTITMRSSQHFK